MPKKLTWENTWGRVDWKTATLEQLKKTTDSGANVFMAGRGADGRVGLPINFVVWNAPNNDIRNEMVDFLYTCMAKELTDKKTDPLAYEEITHLYRKYRYDEKAELEKDNWEELNWEFVSSKVIHKMIKKGLKVNDRAYYEMNLADGQIYNYMKPIHLACKAGNINAVKVLLEEGADPNSMATFARKEYYPIDFVKSMGIANLLIDYGAKVSQEQLDKVKKEEQKRKPYVEKMKQIYGIGKPQKKSTDVSKGIVLKRILAQRFGRK